jgi:hypothetical protein
MTLSLAIWHPRGHRIAIEQTPNDTILWLKALSLEGGTGVIDVLRVFLPYCAQKLKDGSYILLGREYKPVGSLETGWSEWEEHPIVYEVEGLTPKMAAELSWNRNSNVERIYFYNDGCRPWDSKKHFEAYDKRVAKFLGLVWPVVMPERGATGLGVVDRLVH